MLLIPLPIYACNCLTFISNRLWFFSLVACRSTFISQSLLSLFHSIPFHFSVIYFMGQFTFEACGTIHWPFVCPFMLSRRNCVYKHPVCLNIPKKKNRFAHPASITNHKVLNAYAFS